MDASVAVDSERGRLLCDVQADIRSRIDVEEGRLGPAATLAYDVLRGIGGAVVGLRGGKAGGEGSSGTGDFDFALDVPDARLSQLLLLFNSSERTLSLAPVLEMGDVGFSTSAYVEPSGEGRSDARFATSKG